MRGRKQGSISSRTRAFTLVPLLVAWLLCAFATTAHADAFAKPTNPVAREHLKVGNRLYRIREFEKAIEEYKAGALREAATVFHYNLGQCYRQLGRYEEALWHYERFLGRGKPTGEVEQVTRKFIAQMKVELEKQATQRPPAEPTPDPGPTAAQPTPQQPQGERIQAEPAGRDGMPLQRKVAIGLGVGGAAAIGLGIGLGLRARRYEADAAETCPTAACNRADEAIELLDRSKTQALYANIAFGAGAAMIATAAVLWVTSPAGKRRVTAVAPQVSRGFAGFTASLRF